MKEAYTILGIFLLMSCGNKSKPNVMQPDHIVSSFTPNKEILHSDLRKSIKELLKSNYYKEISNIPISESCFILSTWIDPDKAHIYFSDSTINISYFTCNNHANDDYESKYYKGVINVDGYNIAILDFANFADQYYSIDSIAQIPLKSFKCYPANIIIGDTFYLKDGELKHWCP